MSAYHTNSPDSSTPGAFVSQETRALYQARLEAIRKAESHASSDPRPGGADHITAQNNLTRHSLRREDSIQSNASTASFWDSPSAFGSTLQRRDSISSIATVKHDDQRTSATGSEHIRRRRPLVSEDSIMSNVSDAETTRRLFGAVSLGPGIAESLGRLGIISEDAEKQRISLHVRNDQGEDVIMGNDIEYEEVAWPPGFPDFTGTSDEEYIEKLLDYIELHQESLIH